MDRQKGFSPEEIVTAQLPQEVRISPDGTRVVYTRGTASNEERDPVSDIWLVDLEAGTERRLTAGHWCDQTPAWSSCGSYLAFVSDRADRGVGQIYVLPLGGGEAVQVTHQEGRASAPAWSPNGRYLSYLVEEVDDEHERQRKAREGDQWVVDENPHRSHIWILEFTDGIDQALTSGCVPEPRRVTPREVHVGTMSAALYDWAPDSQGFAAIIAESPKVDHLWCAEVATVSLAGEIQRLGTFWGLFNPPSYSPDGRFIAFTGSGAVAPMSVGVPYVVPVDGGPAKTLAVGDRGSANGVTWLPDSKHVLVNLVESLKSEIYAVALEDDQSRLAVKIDGAPGSIVGTPSVSADGTSVAFVRSDAYRPANVWAGTIDGTAREVTNLNPALAAHPRGEVRDLIWNSTDGGEVHGLLFLPVDYQEGQRYPLLTHIHGGPMGAWTHRFYCSWHDWAVPMSARGYAVLMPNPRGSSGRGPDYLAANNADLGGLEWDDIETGIDEVIRLGIADPDQLVVGGWSYGGFFTNWAITHSDRFKAAVSGAAITNWVSFNGTTDVRRIFDAYFASPIHENADGQWERSPVRYINRVNTPTLYLHGDADIRVPISQSYEMYGGLKSRGVETEFVVYPREPHLINERKHQIDMLQRVFDWFDRHLGRQCRSAGVGSGRDR